MLDEFARNRRVTPVPVPRDFGASVVWKRRCDALLRSYGQREHRYEDVESHCCNSRAVVVSAQLLRWFQWGVRLTVFDDDQRLLCDSMRRLFLVLGAFLLFLA